MQRRRSSAEVAEKMIRKLRAGMMPPAGREAARAGGDRRARRVARIAHGSSAPRSIRIPAGVRSSASTAPSTRARCSDLLGIDVDVAAFLPPDTISHGFDNVADAQSFSPTLMEGYLRAASQISRLAVGDRDASAGVGRPTRCGRTGRRCGTSTARRSARAAASSVDAHVPGRRRLRASGVNCTTSRSAASSAATR